MTTEEKLQEMELNLETVLQNQEESGKKLDKILDCLNGNNMGNIGIVKEIEIMKKQIEKIHEDKAAEQIANAKEKARSDIYMGIIKWLAATIALLVIAYMFNQVYNAKPQQVQQQQQPQQQQTQQPK